MKANNDAEASSGPIPLLKKQVNSSEGRNRLSSLETIIFEVDAKSCGSNQGNQERNDKRKHPFDGVREMQIMMEMIEGRKKETRKSQQKVLTVTEKVTDRKIVGVFSDKTTKKRRGRKNKTRTTA
jgi:hypothetical protein